LKEERFGLDPRSWVGGYGGRESATVSFFPTLNVR